MEKEHACRASRRGGDVGTGGARSGRGQISWNFVRSGQEVQLSYGVPESEIVTIVFRCSKTH